MKELKDMTGVLLIIGKLCIRKVGVAYEIWTIEEKKKKGSDGKKIKTREFERVGSHGFLTWCFRSIARDGKANEKKSASAYLNKLEYLYSKIEVRNTDLYMENYREIENKFVNDIREGNITF